MKIQSSILLAVSLFLMACSSQEEQNQLTTEEQEAGWHLLFDGKTLSGWHVYNKGNMDSKWTVNNGELLCDPTKKEGIFGDLITDSVYENFDLQLEWKVTKGGNSGVFINVKEDSSYAATFATGLEMQLLDNSNAEARHQTDSTHWAGCLYAVDCIAQNSYPNPHGHWNTSRIVQKNGKVSFWLNNKLTFERQTQTDDFKQMIASSGMKAYPDFAKYPSGQIALQNHTDSVSFRNIKIIRL
ncbi:3-keto-disaccharide hydrolase [Sphingobacterium paludis]|uniref:Uncharacterized protein DUF1080 n=1 Tax=Sphingobacterium paludis TaxID=1476465 RepID=A0A4R7CSJ7_9SPHI|nr:DUF1080 domain-containing protein [Sphingobacterium paludis]TDS08401.1 uncharacterized protein DUF1080 [Sphingobacterium paludis]